VSELRAVAERAIGGPATLVYRLIADFDRHHPQFLRPAFSDLQVEEGGHWRPPSGVLHAEGPGRHPQAGVTGWE
jgi:hypothetical protein